MTDRDSNSGFQAFGRKAGYNQCFSSIFGILDDFSEGTVKL